MLNEICPHCNTLRDMVVSLNEKDITDEEGKPMKIVTKNYHCSVCNIFVCSEEIKILKDMVNKL